MRPQWELARLAYNNSETFHPFNRLPPELRLKIWKLAFQPKIIHITNSTPHNPRPPHPLPRDYRPIGRACIYHDRIPIYSGVVLLWVNFESRQAYLDNYRPFRTISGPDGRYGYDINFNIDTISFTSTKPVFDRLLAMQSFFMGKIQFLHFGDLGSKRWHFQHSVVVLSDGEKVYEFTSLKSLRYLTFKISFHLSPTRERTGFNIPAFNTLKTSIQSAANAGTWAHAKSPMMTYYFEDLPDLRNNNIIDERGKWVCMLMFVYRLGGLEYERGRWGKVVKKVGDKEWEFPGNLEIKWVQESDVGKLGRFYGVEFNEGVVEVDER